MPPTSEIAPPKEVTLKAFLEMVAPGVRTTISDLGVDRTLSYGSPINADVNKTDIYLYCDSAICSGFRSFRSIAGNVNIDASKSKNAFLSYMCRNCLSSVKTFAVQLSLQSDCIMGTAFKFGESPQFGPPNSPKLISLIREAKDYFLKGRRAENQGMGIAAFAYYRRVVEMEKERIFDQVLRVCNRLSAEQAVIDELTLARQETQFSKAIESLKHGIPQAVFINGQNPLTLLHDALSEGMHAETDEACLEWATVIRVVMGAFAERMAQVMKEEQELNSAVASLIKKKAEARARKEANTAHGEEGQANQPEVNPTQTPP